MKKNISVILSLLFTLNSAFAANSSSRVLSATQIKNGSAALNLNSSGTVTVQNGTYTLIGRDTIDQLSGKTLVAPTADVITLDDQGSTPSNPSSGFYKLYAKTDGKIYKLTPAGVESEIGSGAGGGGFINLLASYNPNAETSSTTNWTNTGSGTFTTTSTAANVGSGTYAFSFDASTSGDRVDSTAVTIPAGLYGQNCILSTRYKGFDSSVTFSVTDGSTVLFSLPLTAAASGYMPLNIPFPCPSSGSLAFRVAATGNAAIGYFDDAYVGENFLFQNVPPVTEWQSFTPTISGLGSVTSLKAYTRRVGDTQEFSISGAAGTVAASTASVTLPNTLIDYSKISSNGAGTQVGQWANVYSSTARGLYNTPDAGVIFVDGSTTNQVFFAVTSGLNVFTKALGNAIFATSGNFNLVFSVPISGWSPQAAVRLDNSDFDWVSYTPTYTGLGSATGTAYYRRVGDSIEVQFNFTAGTVTGSTASISLPSGLIISSTKFNGTGMAGYWTASSFGATVSTHLIADAGTNVINFGLIVGASNGFTKTTGTNIGTGSIVTGHTFLIPVTGWTNSQRAPLLVGSVTSNTSGLERIERAQITCSNSASVVTSQSGSWISSISNGGTAGECTVNLTAAMFSSAPSCFTTVGPTGAAVGSRMCELKSSSTSAVSFACSASGSASNQGLAIICMGPR